MNTAYFNLLTIEIENAIKNDSNIHLDMLRSDFVHDQETIDEILMTALDDYLPEELTHETMPDLRQKLIQRLKSKNSLDLLPEIEDELSFDEQRMLKSTNTLLQFHTS